MRRTQTIAIALVTLAALALGPARANAGSKTSHRAEMESTGVDADARGRAKLQVRNGSDGRFDLQVRRLDPTATYEVLADGVRVGAIVTGRSGGGKLRLRSRPRSGREEFLGFDPRGAVVVVRAASGDDLLAVTFPNDDTPDGNVICCVPDDSGPECEDRTSEECAAQGGTVTTATSCLPDPCSGTSSPPDNDVVCCIPDDSGPECEDRTTAECAAQGGVVVEATSCAPNPCAATPPADADVRCCLGDDSGAECEDRTPAECAAQGGIDLGPGSCTPNPCSDVTVPPAGGTASVRVTCEQRATRSKVSVDGSGLAAGSYSARVVSGANVATTGAQAATAGQAEFDFDSDGGDVAAGATPIAAAFLQGTPPQVLGQILDAQGGLVAESLTTCRIK